MAKANVTVVVGFDPKSQSAWLGVYPADQVTNKELRDGRPLSEVGAQPIWGVELTLSEAEYIANQLAHGIHKIKTEQGQAGHA